MRQSIHDAQVNHADLDEQAILTASRTDPAAFAPLYERHATEIWRFLWRRVADPHLADDLTSRTFVRAIERLNQFTSGPDSSFRAWLFMIARNLMIDELRRRRDVHLVAATLESAEDAGPGPEDIAIHKTEMDAIRAALRSLPERQRSVVELRLAGLNSSEIAQVMGVSVAAVKSAQTRAYSAIRDQFPDRKEPSI